VQNGSSALNGETGPYVLLVGADPVWARAVRATAERLRAPPATVVASGSEGVRRLLRPHPPFTHVLLNPARDQGCLPIILNLTCDESESGAELFLLGRAAHAPARTSIIPGPTIAAMSQALTGQGGTPRVRNPTLRELRHAIENSHIETRYQPVVTMADRAPHTLEVLARLHRGARGVLGPDQFVPRAEAAGLGDALTVSVAGRAFVEAVGPAIAEAGLSVGLNVPLDVLLRPGTLPRLTALREAAGLPAQRVTIELTESRVVSDLPHLRAAVERLRAADYNVALDDISPLMPRHEALLREVPFNAVKLDQDVVRRSGRDGEAASFVRRIVDSAGQRGMNSIAEGVHDAAAWWRMRRMGIDMAQGFVIAPPLPADAVPHWTALWQDRNDLRTVPT
jgi:EAL domain-containing protein (putative c-di-GMP-specific phosphodiesterase class I)